MKAMLKNLPQIAEHRKCRKIGLFENQRVAFVVAMVAPRVASGLQWLHLGLHSDATYKFYIVTLSFTQQKMGLQLPKCITQAATAPYFHIQFSYR